MRQQPNILWIYCDELRSDALGCYGHPTVRMRTPRLDGLAAAGTRFDNCFVNSPVCVPSRTSTLTSRYPEQTGVYSNEAVWPDHSSTPYITTFPRVFSQHGYVTANFGKAHVPKSFQPWQYDDPCGWKKNGGIMWHAVRDSGSTPICPPGLPPVAGAFPAGVPYPPDELAPTAIAWMEKVTEPFFVRVSFLQPHMPVFPRPPFDTIYEQEPIDGVSPPRARVSYFERTFAEFCRGMEMPPEHVRLARQHYYGLVAWVDSQVGLLLDCLSRRGLMESTIIVFDTDHGSSLGEGGAYGKNLFNPQTHRVPRLITWAGTLPGGVVRKDLTDGIDLGRTLLGLCGLEAPQEFAGRNLFADAPPKAVYSTIGYGQPNCFARQKQKVGKYMGHGWPRRACVRTERHRLDKTVRIDGREPSSEEKDLFLADVQVDPLETENRAGDPKYAAVVKELEADLDRHLRIGENEIG